MQISRLAVPVFVFALSAAPAGKFALTIDNIMRGPGLYGYEPAAVRWSADGERLYFQWKQAADPAIKDPDTYVVGRGGSGLRKLTDEEAKLAPPAAGSATLDKRQTVYARDGDIFIYDSTNGRTRQITKTSDIESDPRFTQDGRRVAFTRGNNLYLMSLDSGDLEELTNIQGPAAAAAPGQTGAGGGRGGRGRGAAAEDEQKGTDSQEFLKKQEKDLLEIVRDRAVKREEEEARRKRENPRKPFRLSPTQSIAWLELTPDEKYVVAGVTEAGSSAKTTVVPNYITESGYTEDIPGRTKVGDNQGRVKIAVLGVESGEVKWVDDGQKDREVQLNRPLWSDDGSKAVLQARASDNKDRWILSLDESSGKTRVVAHDHDDDWVDGPGALTLGWMKGDGEIYFQSERTGYSHLYTVSAEGGDAKALTSGKWEVMSAVLSRDKSRFFLVTSEADPGEHNVYEMSASGGARTRLTSLPGGHSFVPSPDDQLFADIYSYTTKPPELYVQEARAGAMATKLTSSPAADFSEYPWLDAPIAEFKARDGAMVRARVFKPVNFARGGPAVIFVHGSGYLQNVHRAWTSSYAHEYLFHNLLREHGYLVIDIDYRGSAGYGRDW